MARYQQLIRVLRLMQVVRDRPSRSTRTGELASLLHVSPRTVRRDLAALRVVGVRVPPHRDDQIQ